MSQLQQSQSVPARSRVEKGGQLLLTLTDNGGVLLETPGQKLRRVQNTVRENWQGEPDPVGELIAERRAEAAREGKDAGRAA